MASHTPTLFEHFSDVQTLLLRLAEDSGAEDARTRDLEQLRKILGKYQECPSVLDASLETLLAIPLLKLQDKIQAEFRDRKPGDSQGFPAIRDEHIHVLFSSLYIFCSVRGRKKIINFFPKAASAFEPVVFLLQSCDPSDSARWETRFGALLWLSMLSLVPFDISSIDSSGNNYLVRELIRICKCSLGESGPSRDTAAMCLAGLLKRPDMDSDILAAFAVYAKQELTSYSEATEFTFIGLLQTLALTMKKGHREKLLQLVDVVFQPTLAVAELFFDTEEDRPRDNILIRKLVMKVLQRIALVYLPPRVIDWRYSRGKRILLDQAATGAEQPTDDPAPEEGTEATDFHVPEAVDEVIEKLLVGLRDKDTAVRWSAAKGIGRIAERIPRSFGDDVLSAVLDLISDAEGSNAWHGALLCIAELARRGLLLPERLPDIVPLLEKAFFYDVRKGKAGVGAHVRDASFYVFWAFARAYDKMILRPFMPQLRARMVAAALYDREINCRRAASAAFQENVGRQGAQNFPHGIAILTSVDFFNVGSISNCYTSITDFVAQFPEYRQAMIAHLLERKIDHWDAEIRKLAAKALGVLALRERHAFLSSHIPTLCEKAESVDLNLRDGSVLSLCEILRAMGSNPGAILGSSFESVKMLPIVFDKNRLFRGRGGELIRCGVNQLIETVGELRLPLSMKQQIKYLQLLEESLRHPLEDVQQTAASALKTHLVAYFPVSSTPSERLLQRTTLGFVKMLSTAANAAASRGAVRALGALPRKLLPTKAIFQEVIAALASAGKSSSAQEEDAETRMLAVASLHSLVGRYCSASVDVELVEQVEKVYQDALEDYAMDKRGDVGSWSRKAALRAYADLVRLVQSKSEKVPHFLDGGKARNVLEKMKAAAGGRPAAHKVHQTREDDEDPRDRDVIGIQVDTGFGRGTIVGLRTYGTVADVDFPEGTFGYTYFGGQALMPVPDLRIPSSIEQNMSCFVVPSSEDRKALLTDEAGKRVLEAFQSREPLAFPGRGPRAVPSSLPSFEEGLVKRLLRSVLKQFGEKLDSVRQCAGSLLMDLLSSDYRRGVRQIPRRRQIVAALRSAAPGAEAWSNAALTFPMLVKIMSLSEYTHCVLEGMIISVGCISEGISKAAAGALLELHKALRSSRNRQVPRLIGDALLEILGANVGNLRVVLPLFKTIDLLFKHEYLIELGKLKGAQAGARTFPERLLAAVQAELQQGGNHKNVSLLNTTASLLIGAMAFQNPTRKEAAKLVLKLMGHRYPLVRKHAAEELYHKLLVDDATFVDLHAEQQEDEDDRRPQEERPDAGNADPESPGNGNGSAKATSKRLSQEALTVVMDALSCTQWDGEMNEARSARQRIAASMQIDLKLTDKPSKASRGAFERKQSEELASYEALVREAGY